MPATPMIEVHGVSKSFGSTRALEDVSLVAEEGRVLGLLGPNGAGKTTLVRILTTLLAPDFGWAKIDGLDCVKDAQRLRSLIGLAGQYAAVDEMLTGRENLELVGSLYHLSRKERRERAQEVLERFDLVDAANRPVKTYSGGMRRRLDLGASLVGQPPVLILDEPTTGLDPRSRVGVWEFISELIAEGTTVLLTTQYLEEADRLADQIVVIDLGKVIAEGTSDELKDQLGGNVLELRVADDSRLQQALDALTQLGLGQPHVDREARRISVPAAAGAATLIDVARVVDEAGIELEDLQLHRPSLDDVFLALTGHAAGSDGADGTDGTDGDGGPVIPGRARKARARSGSRRSTQ
jgi:ABC-2 type transport system ATP-binding protein